MSCQVPGRGPRAPALIEIVVLIELAALRFMTFFELAGVFSGKCGGGVGPPAVGIYLVGLLLGEARRGRGPP